MQQHFNSTPTIQARSLRSKRKKTVDIFVSAGSFTDPYYTFSDKKGRQIESFEFNPSTKYRFRRAGKASTHPFYISDQGWNEPATKKLKLKGDGDFNSGIIDSGKITLSIKKKHQEDFSTSGRLFFYCTSHASMLDEFIIDAGRKKSRQRISDESFQASKHFISAEGMGHQHPTTSTHEVPLISAEPWIPQTTSWVSAVAILNIRS